MDTLALFRILSLRSLRMHWPRTGLVVLSIALGVATWVATDALHGALEKSLRQAATPLDGADLYITNSARGRVEAALAEVVRAVPGVKSVDPIIIEQATAAREKADLTADEPPNTEASARRPVTLFGVPDPSDEGSRNRLLDRGIEVEVDDWKAAFWALARGETPVLVGQQMDEEFLKKKDTLVIQAAGKAHTLRRVGQVRASGPAALLGGYIVVARWEDAARLFDRPGTVHRLDVTLADDVDRERTVRRVKDAVGNKAEVQSIEERNQRLDDLKREMEAIFKLCGAGALVVGLFLVFNAMSVTVSERRHDIGILRSVGATAPQVGILFLGEALLMGLAGATLGLPLGIGMAQMSLGPLQTVLRGIYLPMRGRDVETTPALLVAAAASGMATALLGAMLPALRAAREEPAAVVRRAPPVVSATSRVLQMAASVVLIAAGFLVMSFRSSLPERGWVTPDRAVYVAPGLLLFGALLAAPLLATLLTRLVVQPFARACLPIPSRLAADNLVRSPGRTGLVVAALTAVVALTVMTAGVIRSNEDAFLGWVENTVKADLYVSSGGPVSSSGQTKLLKETVADDLRKLLPPDSKLVGLAFRFVEWDAENGHPSPGSAAPAASSPRPATRIFMILADAEAYCRANAGLPEPDPQLDRWRKLGRGRALVSENFARIHRVGRGDTIQFKGQGGMVSLEVADTIVDYNWIRGTVFIDRQAYKQELGADEVSAWEVYLPRGTDAEAVRERVQKSPLATRHSLVTVTRPEVRDNWRDLVRRIYGVAYTQEVLVGVVAVMGVVASLLISVLGRQRELGLLRAVGGTRGQLLHTVLAEAVLIGLVGTLLGLVVGLPMEWYAVRVVLFEETGFLFAMRIPWLEAGVIAALAVLAATLAGLGPAVHAMRLRIADAIAYE